jgi:Zn-dependent protease
MNAPRYLLNAWRYLRRPVNLGWLGPLYVTGERSVLVGFAVVWVLMLALASQWVEGTGFDRLMAATLAALGHWFWDLMHHVGHYLAGLYAGHPMRGIHLYGVLIRSVYPPNEPALAANIHIRRAIGGPAMSICMALLCLLFQRIFPSDILWFFFYISFWDNLLVMTLGALLPVAGLDGHVILRQWKHKKLG